MSDNLMKRNALLFARSCWVLVNNQKKPTDELLTLGRKLNVNIETDEGIDEFECDDCHSWVYVIDGSIFKGNMVPDSIRDSPKFRIKCETDDWDLWTLNVENIRENIVKLKQTDRALFDRYGIYLEDDRLCIVKTYDLKELTNIVSGFFQIRDDTIAMAQLYQKLVS